MSNALEIGKRLVELCRQGKHLEAVETLYAPEIVSVEAFGNEQMPQRKEGIAAIREKNKGWLAAHEIHSNEVTGPWPHGDRFIVGMKMDVTAKSGEMAGKRMTFDEAALYTVRDEKIVKEEFFYAMPS